MTLNDIIAKMDPCEELTLLDFITKLRDIGDTRSDRDIILDIFRAHGVGQLSGRPAGENERVVAYYRLPGHPFPVAYYRRPGPQTLEEQWEALQKEVGVVAPLIAAIKTESKTCIDGQRRDELIRRTRTLQAFIREVEARSNAYTAERDLIKAEYAVLVAH